MSTFGIGFPDFQCFIFLFHTSLKERKNQLTSVIQFSAYKMELFVAFSWWLFDGNKEQLCFLNIITIQILMKTFSCLPGVKI